MPGTPVILFKTPSEPPSSDAYHIRLTDAGFHPLFVPVLAERWVVSQLAGILRGGHSGLREETLVENCTGSGAENESTEIATAMKWEGVIVSSRRGAEGWIQAAKEASSGSERSRPSWNDVPLFTVGTSALDVFRESHSHIPPHLQPNLDTSASAKSASLLVPAIIDRPPRSNPAGFPLDTRSDPSLPKHGHPDYETTQGKRDARYGRYLVIRGDKSLDEIPRRLRDAGREVVEVVIYETTERRGLEDDLRSVMTQLLGSATRGEGDGAEPIWLGFFSPSSAGMILSHLHALLGSPTWEHSAVLPRKGTRRHVDGDHEMGSSAEAGSGDVATLRLAAIGETTRAYLESVGMEVAAVAEQPTAEGLVEAIRACACK